MKTVKKLVNAAEVQNNVSTLQTLTLMTCLPPETTFKRLLVIATLEEE